MYWVPEPIQSTVTSFLSLHNGEGVSYSALCFGFAVNKLDEHLCMVWVFVVMAGWRCGFVKIDNFSVAFVLIRSTIWGLHNYDLLIQNKCFLALFPHRWNTDISLSFRKNMQISITCGTIVSSRLCILLSGKSQSMLGDVVQNSQLWATVGFMTCDDQLELCNVQPVSVPALLGFSNHTAVLRWPLQLPKVSCQSQINQNPLTERS